MQIDQIAIAVLGATAIWLVGRREHWRKYGYLVGLLSQPFWLYASYKAEQWGIFALSIWYGYCWIQGLKNNWRAVDLPK